MSKKQPKLTPWFPLAHKPARDGVYQTRKAGSATYFSFYSKNQWHGEWITPERAYMHSWFTSGITATEWRGLAVKHG